jgi:hypothetical protein
MTNRLAHLSNETIFFDAYQTGIDNYRIEIKSKVEENTKDLFNYYVNDGVFTASTLQASIKGDTVFIFSKYPAGDEKAQTKFGRFVMMKSFK